MGARGKLPQGCRKGPLLSPDPDLPLCRLPGSTQEARAELEQRAARGWRGQGCAARQSASHGELGAWPDPARSPRPLGARPGPPGTPAPPSVGSRTPIPDTHECTPLHTKSDIYSKEGEHLSVLFLHGDHTYNSVNLHNVMTSSESRPFLSHLTGLPLPLSAPRKIPVCSPCVFPDAYITSDKVRCT